MQQTMFEQESRQRTHLTLSCYQHKDEIRAKPHYACSTNADVTECPDFQLNHRIR